MAPCKTNVFKRKEKREHNTGPKYTLVLEMLVLFLILDSDITDHVFLKGSKEPKFCVLTVFSYSLLPSLIW